MFACSGGGGNESRLNGTWNAEFFQDVVLVTFNYRLNVFGFLGAEALRSRSPDGSTGNYGLQDQRFAIQVHICDSWVCVDVFVYLCVVFCVRVESIVCFEF